MSGYRVDALFDRRVPMRDGVELSADVYLPSSDEPAPVVVIRTPYGNHVEDGVVPRALEFAAAGYVCVVQDVQGRFDSDGEWYAFRSEAADGKDTLDWVAEQPWCNGRVGMSGGSYLGIVQWAAAMEGPARLDCIAPRVAPRDLHSGIYYHQGALNLYTALGWNTLNNAAGQQPVGMYDWDRYLRVLPLQELEDAGGKAMPHLRDLIRHPNRDGYWDESGYTVDPERVTVPTLMYSGWYDIFVKGTFENFTEMRAQGGSPEARKPRLVCGPWIHQLNVATEVGDIEFGPGAEFDLNGLEIRWMDRWLRDERNGVEDEAPLLLYIMGGGGWREEYEWPLARTDWQKWYLHSDGHAPTGHGDGTLSVEASEDEQADRFTYDPDSPVPTIGGNTCCWPEIVPWGPMDQRPVEERPDVLCYSSAPLEADMEVTGPIKVTLYASSSAPDTDFTAKLVDVYPFGCAVNIVDGIVRARYREGPADPSPIEPGRVYEYEIDLGPTANVFRRGHRIRLEVSSSNFPHYDRNPNTGHEFGKDAELRVAEQTVLHSAEYRSHVVLPVVPAS